MPISEFRRDIVSGDWVVIATGRAKRPHAFIRSKEHDGIYTRLRGCPFERPQASGNPEPLMAKGRTGQTLTGPGAARDWFTQVIPNKFPAFTPGVLKKRQKGPFAVMSGAGYHELVLMRDHDRHWGHYTSREAATVFSTYLDRYRALVREPFVEYVSIFHNFGKEAGASLYHPHSQIIAVPVVPPDVQRSFDGSGAYYRKERRCVHCDMLTWELREKLRLVAVNRTFVAYCPFASRTAFEVRIFPRHHIPCFDAMSDEEVRDCGDMLRQVLGRVRRRLGNPSYNFFIHTSTGRGICKYPQYHWHIEIIPKIAMWAGFEIATGIEISTVSPEEAASFLRARG